MKGLILFFACIIFILSLLFLLANNTINSLLLTQLNTNILQPIQPVQLINLSKETYKQTIPEMPVIGGIIPEVNVIKGNKWYLDFDYSNQNKQYRVSQEQWNDPNENWVSCSEIINSTLPETVKWQINEFCK